MDAQNETITTTNIAPFEAYVYERCAAELTSWPAALGAAMVRDIYVISFCIDDAHEARYAFHPALYLSYNTLTKWRSEIAHASDADEAKWRLPYWTADYRLVSPPGETYPADPEAVRLRDAWLHSLGLTSSPESGAPFDEDAFDSQAEWDAFIPLCARVARRLHERGVLVATFGAPVPILIHDLDYSDATIRYIPMANPDGVAQEYIDYELRELRMFFPRWRTEHHSDLRYDDAPQYVWDTMAKRCSENAFIRQGLRQWDADGRLAQEGIWTSAQWAEHGLTPPWDADVPNPQ